MSYCLEQCELPADGIRRVAREQLERAIEDAGKLGSADEAEAVHSIRKRIKKLSTLLSLLKKQLGKEIYRNQRRRLSRVANCLSRSRDADAALQVFERLRKESGRPRAAFAATSAVLTKQLAETVFEQEKQRRRVVATLESINDALDGWPVQSVELEFLSCGLARSYRRARKTFRCVRKRECARLFHRWRKRTKELSCQTRLLKLLDPDLMNEIADAAETIGRKLGDLHDLNFLRERLRNCTAAPKEERQIVLDLICARENELKTVALNLGSRFFCEKPARFRRRLSCLVRDGRS